MEDLDLLKRIEWHPRVMAGKAVIRGTRLTVEPILNLLAHGETVERITAEYGSIAREDVLACVLFAPLAAETVSLRFLIGYGLVTYEGAGLLTTYGGVSLAGPQSHGYRLGGRIELGAWTDLSVEGERSTQGGGAEQQVARYGHPGW